jgi:hypothetical protein
LLKRKVYRCTLKCHARGKIIIIEEISLTSFMESAVQDDDKVRRWEGAALLQIQR